MGNRQAISDLLATPDLSIQLREKLTTALEIRDFASNELHLPENNSYRSYIDLARKYVVWNVIATPEFSLEPVQWCFLIIGCLPYRGYFSKMEAMQFADKLRAKGYDVHLGGVTAYSTLGWFDDPLLNTMLQHDETYLAKVIFHELAHQKFYIKDDTNFNEAFADSIALIGVRRWLDANYTAAELHQFEQSQKRENEFIQLVITYKNKLNELYNSKLPEQDKRTRKLTLFNHMITDYWMIRASWGGYEDYDTWFEDGLNNARLSTLLTYKDLVPKFLALFAAEENDLERFYTRIEQFKYCDLAARRSILNHGIDTLNCKNK